MVSLPSFTSDDNVFERVLELQKRFSLVGNRNGVKRSTLCKCSNRKRFDHYKMFR